ncbi:hypothetical protein NT6N_16240 [Oceaniferula spumae]|uniref:Uncharacterized protein n=1 Tax=Oceaniferula spumae TaxID=2979115 RepID=A0AAT9FKT3_9BACT
MNRRFEFNHPLRGRSIPRNRIDASAPRQATRHSKPAQRETKPSDTQSEMPLFTENTELNLGDEISAEELNSFACAMFAQLGYVRQNKSLNSQEAQNLIQDVVTKLLPGYVLLKNDYQLTLEAKNDQKEITERLVKATEPVLSNASVSEADKQKLLDASYIVVEKMMQLKMRTSHLQMRVDFLNQEVPGYLANHGKLMGYSEQLCKEAAQLTQAVLQSY